MELLFLLFFTFFVIHTRGFLLLRNIHVTANPYGEMGARSTLAASGFGKDQVPEKGQYVERDPAALCQCGSSLLYKDCCLPVHEVGGSNDPMRVVRSRFSALRYGIIDHMIKTTDPSHKDYVPKEKSSKYKKYFKDLQKYSNEYEFLELKFEDDNPVEFDEQNDKAHVTFAIKLERKQGGKMVEVLREKSTFKRGIYHFWFYAEGELRGMKSSDSSSERLVDMSSVNRDGKNSVIALGTQKR